MQSFVYTANAARVLFGAGTLAQLPAEVDRLGAKRVLVLSTPGHAGAAARLAALLGERAAGTFTQAAMHVPVAVAQAAVAEARRLEADATVAIGGGSTTGLAKAVALELGLPIVAVPTTYAGSEVTTMWGLTEGGAKRTGRTLQVLPKTVIYDPELTLSLPLALTVTSAFNAMAHAAEGLYAPDGNPVVSLMAADGIRACAAALPPLARDLRDAQARHDALYGAWLCGMVMGVATMGLHHKLCHTLGGSFGLPHAEAHTVLLPHALAYNAPAAPQAMARIAAALGVAGDAPLALWRLAKAHGAPLALAAIGMPEDGLDRAADIAVSAPYPNPRPLERAALRALLARAWAGEEPRP